MTYIEHYSYKIKMTIICLLLAMAQVAFAQSKACQDEKNKATAMKSNCVEINKSKGTDEFNKCLENLKVQVAKANKICEAGNQEPQTAPAPAPAPKPVAAPASKPKTIAKPAPKPEPVAKKKDPIPAKIEPKEEPAPQEEEEPYEEETEEADGYEENATEYKEYYQPEEKNKITQAVKSSESEGTEEIRYGARVNFGISGVYSSVLQVNGQEIYMERGTSYGLGGFAIIPTTMFFHFVPEISIQHREPIKINNEGHSLTISETAIEIPLIFRFLYGKDNLIYVGAGVFAGMVLDLAEDPAEANGKSVKDLRSKDYGLVLEVGYRINDNFSVDARGAASAASFGIGEYLDAGDTPRLIQAQIGVSYVF